MANDHRRESEGEHTLLIGVSVIAPTREIAEECLFARWRRDEVIESYWIAEDVRHDRSDNDSAIFVPMGRQDECLALLRAHGLLAPTV